MIFLTIAATALTIFAFLQSPIAGRRANDIEANFEFFGQKAEIKSQSIFDDRKEQPPSHEELLFSSISGSLVRLSAVLFAAFLIQHMAAFARYNMQIATRPKIHEGFSRRNGYVLGIIWKDPRIRTE